MGSPGNEDKQMQDRTFAEVLDWTAKRGDTKDAHFMHDMAHDTHVYAGPQDPPWYWPDRQTRQHFLAFQALP
jgi:hypothetical protein